MIKSCATVLLCLVVLHQVALASASLLWPLRFSMEFSEDTELDSDSTHVTKGKIWYESEQRRSLVAREKSGADRFCTTVPGVKAHEPCMHLVSDNEDRFLVFPDSKQCCMCCQKKDGCGFLDRDWVRHATWEKVERIGNRACDRFRIDDGIFWLQDHHGKPCRLIEEPDRDTKTFIDGTFSEAPIPASMFAKPDYCDVSNLCPGRCEHMRT